VPSSAPLLSFADADFILLFAVVGGVRDTMVENH
jgi:hypothetical protein